MFPFITNYNLYQASNSIQFHITDMSPKTGVIVALLFPLGWGGGEGGGGRGEVGLYLVALLLSLQRAVLENNNSFPLFQDFYFYFRPNKGRRS